MILTRSPIIISIILKKLFKPIYSRSIVYSNINNKEDLVKASKYILKRDRPNRKLLYTSNFSLAIKGSSILRY